MPNFGVHTAESLAQSVNAIIHLLESRDANGAESEANALLADLKSLVAPVYDPNKRGAPRPIYAAEQAGLDLAKTRALKSAIQRALASIEANDVSQALRHCHQAQREWLKWAGMVPLNPQAIAGSVWAATLAQAIGLQFQFVATFANTISQWTAIPYREAEVLFLFLLATTILELGNLVWGHIVGWTATVVIPWERTIVAAAYTMQREQKYIPTF